MASLVVKATHALDEPERAHLACNVASVGLAAGLDVHVFLAVEGVRLAVPGIAATVRVEQAPPLEDLVAALYAGGEIVVCTSCAARRGLALEDFRPGTVMAGAARFVELATAPDATALVY